MAEELKSLLDKIQKDGIEKAQQQADGILAAAREKAAAILSAAERQAKATQETAQQEGAQLVERGRQSLGQAARDVVLSVGEALNQTLAQIVSERVTQSVPDDTLRQMLVSVVEAYSRPGAGGGAVEVIVPQPQQEEIRRFFMSKFSDRLRDGLTVRGDKDLIAGFRVSVAGGKLEHDFSAEAIAEALCRLLRPHLAEIVRKAVPTAGGKRQPAPPALVKPR